MIIRRCKKQLRTIRYLLEKNADPNRADFNGRTPLSLALENGNLEVVKLLIEHGAAIDKEALEDALMHKYTEIEIG